MTEIFKRVEPGATIGLDPALASTRLPGADPAKISTLALTVYPNQNDAEPGLLIYGWPARRKLNNTELYMLELFFENLASDETSTLYQKFIDSQNRLMDIGASSVFSWVDTDPGQPAYLGFSNINAEVVTEPMLDSIRAVILGEISKIAAYADGSDELEAFNERARNRVIEQRRGLRKFLNTPPRFGYRGTGSRWLDHLQRLNNTGGFVRSLILEDELTLAESQLKGTTNIWRDYIASWKLISDPPYGVASRPDPQELAKSETNREERIATYIRGLKEKYKTDNSTDAIALFKKDYDANTAEIDSGAATIEMPAFINNPPLGIDDQLNYRVTQFGANGSMVASTFNNISSGTGGLALNLDVVPESQLMYAAALPTLISDIGVIRDGQPVSYDRVSEMMRREILSFRSYFSVNHKTERAELVLRAAGSNADEIDRALGWMETFLFSPNIDYKNIDRIRDAIDLRLSNHRNRMRRSEESWVNTPVRAFWKQHNPLLLVADNFLTQEHALLRLRWQLKEADSDETAGQFAKAASALSGLASSEDRETFSKSLDAVIAEQIDDMGELKDLFVSLSPDSRELTKEAAKDMRQSLSGIPDGSLSDDMAYLARQMTADLNVHPKAALDNIVSVLGLIRRADNGRAFAVANEPNLARISSRMGELAARLGAEPSARQVYGSTPRVTERLRQHEGADAKPIFVGLVNPSTRAGVHINTSDCASFSDTDENHLLKFLSARLYGGGGAHSMFMKTWGAGLAYSNGLRSNEVTGRLTYYAERCPDLAQTMQFVVNELENAPYDPSLADYAVSQAFAVVRSGSTYESRGEAMADDIADGLMPEVVHRFRKGVLDLRESKTDLYRELHERMASTYGEVLPGYGVSASEAAAGSNAIYFVIGPEKQLQSYERYLSEVEKDAKLYRLYPRDFWLVE